MDIHDFAKKKKDGHLIKMTTCYDHWTAKILAETNIDCILVGDSAAMVMHGYSSTTSATVEMMEWHIKAVRAGSPSQFIIGDLPFMSYRKSLEDSITNTEKLIRAGANAVKLEGLAGNELTIKHIVDSGIPVLGHLGFTPQSINAVGHALVQGKNQQQAQKMLQEARTLEQLGCFALVLECIPEAVAESITKALSIPTIGIGAGAKTSGQVLVLHDMIGTNPQFAPKFLKRYSNIHQSIKDAVNHYCLDVDQKIFPSQEHTYKVSFDETP